MFNTATGTINGWLQQGGTIIPIGGISAQSATQFSGSVAIACANPTGSYDVYYSDTDPSTPYDTLSLAAGFTVNANANLAYSPNNGLTGNTINVAFTSSCAPFGTSSSTTHKGWIDNGTEQYLLTNVTANSTTLITGLLELECEAPGGMYQMYYCSYDSVTQVYDTTIFATPFSLTPEIAPQMGSPGNNLALTISGSGVTFQPGTSTLLKGWLNLGGNQLLMNNVAYNGQDWTADLNIPASATDGSYTVQICRDDTAAGTSDTATLNCGFNVVCLTNCDSVWPGDANDDGIANNMDLLELGMAFGAGGPARATVSNAWMAQAAPSWGAFTPSGNNFKHSDCDGDGMIGYADTLAILQNYGLTHNKTSGGSAAGGDPTLFLTLPADSASLGATLMIPVELGTAAAPINAAYGVAFSILYNPALVDPSTVQFTPSGSWLGNAGVNAISMDVNHIADGRLDVAMCRIDQNNTSGFGQVGLLSFTTASSISTDALPLDLEITATQLIDNAATDIPVVAGETTLTVLNQPDFVPEQGDLNPVQIFPNPFHASTTVLFPNPNNEPFEAILRDLEGKTVQVKGKVTGNRFALHRDDLAAGVYLLELRSPTQRWVKRVVID